MEYNLYDSLSQSDNIFDYSTSGEFPWGENYNADIAEVLNDVLLNDYGARVVSLRLKRMIVDGMISSDNVEKLRKTLAMLYGEQLKRKYAILELQYNPVSNANRTESETITDDYSTTESNQKDTSSNSDSTRTDDLSQSTTSSNSDTRTDDLSQTVSMTKNGNSADYKYGFNSSDKSPSAETVDTSNDNETTSNTGTQKTESSGSSSQSNTGTQKNTSNVSANETENKSGTNKGTRETTRKIEGSIGVITTQTMIKQEIELWKWSFYVDVIKTFSEYLCSTFYEYML